MKTFIQFLLLTTVVLCLLALAVWMAGVLMTVAVNVFLG